MMGDDFLERYNAFLRAKVVQSARSGIICDPVRVNPLLKPHQVAAVCWAVEGGRRALFESFGLGKTVQQLEILRIILEDAGGRALIIAPLGVRQEFARDAAMLGTPLKFIRRIEEAGSTGIYITNYETVRDGKLDPAEFIAVSLDEAAVLRGFGGTKTFREFMAMIAGDRKTMAARTLTTGVKYRFVATATPSPNDYIELLAYSAFLGIMDVGAAKTRFFKRNSEKADHLTIHPHKETEFWLWVASWALFVQKPSDLGFNDTGYALPPVTVNWHEVSSDHRQAGEEKSGQMRLFQNAAIGVSNAAREKRSSLNARIMKLMQLRAEAPGKHRIIWHDLETERAAIERAFPECCTVWGSQDMDERESRIMGFCDGEIPELATKLVIAGAGTNMQRHCAWEIFLGIGFKFHDFIQGLHRVVRFGQTRPVRIDIIYTEAEREIRRALETKWRQHNEMVEKMTAIIKEFGLSEAAMAQSLCRAMGTERIEVSGDRFRMIRNDAVPEAHAMPTSSIDLIVTSIPFATQYEYSPNFADFGHTDTNAHFFEQMDFLLPNLFRVLRPGRIAAIHVKDRVVPGGLTGLGFQTVYPFADDCRTAFRKAGFAYLGEKTNLTDVVRENNQTYRLGHTEQLKDGTRMGCGIPEKVLLFRKPPTDPSKGYADDPVVKPRPGYVDRNGAPKPYSRVAENRGSILPVAGTGYSRARWQIDAHHLSRASGDRLVSPEEWCDFDAQQIYRLWREWNLSRLYDFEHHVRIGEELQARGKLPPTFMLLPPHSWHPDVWTDVAQMLSLNTLQSAAGAEKHLCPMPFDICDRLIAQFSEPDELVLDPFAGIGSVPYRAIKLGRRGIGIELSATYFLDAVKYCESMEREMAVPTLFDLLDAAS